MQKGSLVECIDDSNFPDYMYINVTLPSKGDIYVVRGFTRNNNNRTGIYLEEIINSLIEYNDGQIIEPAFLIERFKELQPPMNINNLIEEFLNLEI